MASRGADGAWGGLLLLGVTGILEARQGCRSAAGAHGPLLSINRQSPGAEVTLGHSRRPKCRAMAVRRLEVAVRPEAATTGTEATDLAQRMVAW
ncbi:hypothetical protein ACTI_47730 [Actinoplanes sp. OR16]|nr:hypothetical protein ACTI_47730 [Actinoplanes sp. OR16]